MSADILAAIIGDDSVSIEKPNGKKEPTRPMTVDAMKAATGTLVPYGLRTAFHALSTHHHAQAVGIAKAIIETLAEAMQSPRKTALDGALDAIGDFVAQAKAERKQSDAFERAMLLQEKTTTVGKFLGEYSDELTKDYLCDHCGKTVADILPSSGNERVCYSCNSK